MDGETLQVMVLRCCLLCVMLFLAQNVSALAISLTPDQIDEGDQVTISITDLPDTSLFSIQIQGTFAATPGGIFSFELENMVLPFSMNDGFLSATLWNTSTNQLIFRKGDTEVKKVGLSQGGVYSTTDSGSIPSGTFDLISLGGTAAQDATSITTSMTLQGNKSGPEDSAITFVVNGVTDGSVTITILVDGETALSQTLQVGNGITPTATATTTITTTTTTSPTTTTSTTTTATTTATPTPNSTASQPATEMLLQPGWNFISVPKALAEGHNTADVVFSGVNKEGHSIFTYDGEIGAWTQLRYGDTVELLDGIWIYSADSRYVSLSYIQQTSPEPSYKPLYTGWNSIGFASAQPVAAREALGALLDHWDQVIGFDSTSQFYEVSIVRNGSGSHSDANPVYPFRGYWIRMTSNSTLSS